MIPTWLLPADLRDRMREIRTAQWEDALKTPLPWDDAIKWQRVLPVQAASFQARIGAHRLFDVVPILDLDPILRAAPDPRVVESPDHRWRYCERVAPRAAGLSLDVGRDRGTVVMDGPITFPQLWTKNSLGMWGGFDRVPLMSLTPQELMTLRRGTRLAKGHVVIGGLGLGWQLARVCERKQVKRVTVVEIDRGLVDWLWPRIEPFCSGRPVDFVIDDIKNAGKTLTADVALVDTFDDLGDRSYERTVFEHLWPNIQKVWCWGVQDREK